MKIRNQYNYLKLHYVVQLMSKYLNLIIVIKVLFKIIHPTDYKWFEFHFQQFQ